MLACVLGQRFLLDFSSVSAEQALEVNGDLFVFVAGHVTGEEQCVCVEHRSIFFFRLWVGGGGAPLALS